MVKSHNTVKHRQDKQRKNLPADQPPRFYNINYLWQNTDAGCREHTNPSTAKFDLACCRLTHRLHVNWRQQIWAAVWDLCHLNWWEQRSVTAKNEKLLPECCVHCSLLMRERDPDVRTQSITGAINYFFHTYMQWNAGSAARPAGWGGQIHTGRDVNNLPFNR